MQWKTFLFMLFITHSLLAEEKKHIIYFGMNYPNYIFTVKDLNNGTESKMVHSKTSFPTVGIGSPPSPLFGTYVRWSYDFSVAPFSTNRQIVNRNTDPNLGNSGNGNEFAFGSKIHGYVNYFNPTLDFYLPINDDYYFYVGVGIGLGFANIWGNYYQTDVNSSAACQSSTTSNQIISNCNLINVKYARISTSTNVLFVLNLNNFAIRYDIGGPEVKYLDKRFSTYNTGVALVYQYRY